MLIYGDNGNTSFGDLSSYKSAHKRQRASIRVKAPKRASQTKKRNKAGKSVKKSKKRRSKHIKKLSAKNLKFLKRLGLRVKKQ